MKMRYILILIPIFLFGCKTENLSDQIAVLKDGLQTDASVEKTNQLASLLQTYLGNKENTDPDQSSTYSNDLAKLQIGQNKFPEAAGTLSNALSNSFSGSGTTNNIALLASLYGNQLKSSVKDGKAFAAFKGFFSDENTMKSQLASMIEAQKKNIYDEATHRIDPEVSSNYISLCELYANVLPTDPQSPAFLFQAGETARSTRNFRKALDIYDVIYAKYKDFDKAPQALFLKAFTLDNDLKQHDKAKALYTTFLAQYPNDDFADDTKFLLENLGKSDDEIIKKFEK